MVLQIPSSSKAPTVTWEALPADFVLPGDPVENIQQPPLAAALTDALGAAGLIRPIALIGSNLGLVATVNKQTVLTSSPTIRCGDSRQVKQTDLNELRAG